MNKAIDIKNPILLYRMGFDILARELGAVGATRFIQLFDNGHGDYTKEKYEHEDLTVGEIAEEIYAMRKKRD